MQFGTNIRLVTNARTSFAAAYDNAVTNPSFYDFSGDVVLMMRKTGLRFSRMFPPVRGST